MDEDLELQQDEFTSQFLSFAKKENESIENIILETKFTDLSFLKNEKLLEKNGLYELYELPQGKFIVYHWATCRFAFGFWLDDLEKEESMVYYFSPEIKKEIPLAFVRFLSCAGIHSKLLQREALVFHASYIDWNGKGILFCGKSGMGKSTQADLWNQYANAEIINGDRVLLKKENNQWKCFGYPCCGSSAICLNRTLPLHAIVVLQQGKENVITNISMSEKIKSMILGSERYFWSEKEMNLVLKLAEMIAFEVPILKFECRPDEEAVKVLKDHLERM